MHRLSDINGDERTGVCSTCGSVSLRHGGRLANGQIKWRCSKARWKPKMVYTRHKKSACENVVCTATILAPCQLDVHHKDGNHSNNDPSNLETLCANCHRLEH